MLDVVDSGPLHPRAGDARVRRASSPGTPASGRGRCGLTRDIGDSARRSSRSASGRATRSSSLDDGFSHDRGRPPLGRDARLRRLRSSDAWTRRAAGRADAQTVGIVAVHLYGGPRTSTGWPTWPSAGASGSSRTAPNPTGRAPRAHDRIDRPCRDVLLLPLEEPDRFRRWRHGRDERRGGARRPVRLLRDHGRTDKSTHVAVGFNLRFNEVQASVGRLQLADLETYVESDGPLPRGTAGLSGSCRTSRCPRNVRRRARSYHLYPSG